MKYVETLASFKILKKKNNYDKCLVKAENKLEIATLANKLTLKLESLSDEKLYNTLKYKCYYKN